VTAVRDDRTDYKGLTTLRLAAPGGGLWAQLHPAIPAKTSPRGKVINPGAPAHVRVSGGIGISAWATQDPDALDQAANLLHDAATWLAGQQTPPEPTNAAAVPLPFDQIVEEAGPPAAALDTPEAPTAVSGEPAPTNQETQHG